MTILGWDEWKGFFVRLYVKADTTDVTNRAALVAFYFSFAFLPLLLFLVSLAGLILGSTNELKSDLYSYLFRIMPISAYDLIHTTLDEIIEKSSGGKLTLGLFITLWSASAGVDALRSALNAVYELKESRSWWWTKVQSLSLTFLFIILLVVGLLTVSAGLQVFDYVVIWAGFTADSPLLLTVVQWITLLALLLFTTEVIYNWIPCHNKFRWYWATPGSIVAMILWLILSGGFRIYLHFFNTYNNAYGSLGAVIILMLWMFLTATAILIGGSINSVLKEMQDGRNSVAETKTEAEPDRTTA